MKESFKNAWAYNKNQFIKSQYFFLFTIIFFSRFLMLNGECNSGSKIEEGSNCFNRIIRFGVYYRAGQFTIRKDGVLFIEYSSGDKRMFYGLKPNGRGYFSNDNTNKEITTQGISYDENGNRINIKERYESKNRLIYLSGDSSQENPYILSVSSFKSLTELHHFDNEGNNSHVSWLTTDFFGITEKERIIFSYQFSLLEYGNLYYAAYVQYKGKGNDGKDYSVSYTLSKFKFTESKTVEHSDPKEYNDNYDNRIVSAFIFNKYESLAVIFLKSNGKYTLRLHDFNELNNKYETEIYGIDSSKANPGEGVFFKAIYLQYEYFAFIFFSENNNGYSLKLLLLKLIIENGAYNLKYPGSKDINSDNFDTSIRRNEFYKIDDIRLLFVSTISQTKLILMFFETYDWYKNINTRTYSFDIGGYNITEELSVDFFNGFLMFTASVVPVNDGSLLSSLLLFFSYPNGTDFYLNISPYVMDSEYYSNDNLIEYLLNKCTIENNIFGYSLIDEIKLISIPNEIQFYREGSDAPLTNGEKISKSHKLKQNKNLIKYNKNYTLDYQFMALGKGKNIDVFNQAHKKDIPYQGEEFEKFYSQKTYYGRVNRLTFSLCHDYCETCKELGISNDDQKCTTCLPQYTYDYYRYNNYPNLYPGNCVPEGYYNELGQNPKLVKCDSSNSKFYYNKTDDNKRICFDKLKDCPETYSFLNETNYECLNYTPPFSTIPIIPTTIPIIPTTIPIIQTTIPIIQTTIPIIPTTIPEIPTTLPIIITTMPIITTTIPIISTKIPIIPTTIPVIPTTLPIIPSTNPLILTTEQKIETTILINPTTIPIYLSTIPKLETTIPKETTNIPEISTNKINPTDYDISITTYVKNFFPTTIPNPQEVTSSQIIMKESSIINQKEQTTLISTIPKIDTTLTELLEIPTSSQKTSPNIQETTILEHKEIDVSTTPSDRNQTIIQNGNCLNGANIIPLCSNLTNEQLYSKLIKEIFDSYSLDKTPKIYVGKDDLKLRISNTLNEWNNDDSNNDFSLIDLGKCEKFLKKANNIPPNSELIILKIQKTNEDLFDYTIFNPITYEKLDLSICKNVTLNLYKQFELPEEKEKYYNELIEQGYNPFDKNDKFYREICTPYKSENGTDVLLDEREEFFYYPIAELMVCQNNCQYSSYSMDTKYVKCECGNNQTLVTLNLKKISKENILQSFLSTFTSTNYKVMRCYNLVFNLKIFKRNYGSIITSILFIIYFITMICYCNKNIYRLKIEISKILFDNSKNDKKENEKISIFNKIPNKNDKNKKIKEINEKNTKKNKNRKKDDNPPKKNITNKTSGVTSSIRKTSEKNLVIFTKGSRKNLKKNKIISPKSKIKEINSESKSNDNKSLVNFDSKNYMNNLNDKKDNLKKKKDEEEEEEKKDLDNYELNGLDYKEACELDKRGFCLTYWSVLMREHLLLFTFFSCTDYNLFYIKFERFITLFCIEMTFNGLFFVHESMHRKYVEQEELTFVQKLPQLLFTLIISHIFEVILCYFGMTDTYIYLIKDIPNSAKKGKKVIEIMEKMKKKLIGFFIFTFLLFIFNWYFISAFCAVYQNTQIIFLKDTAISFLSSMTDPFMIYGGTVFLRYISLMKCCKNKLGCVYKLSDLIPIF